MWVLNTENDKLKSEVKEKDERLRIRRDVGGLPECQAALNLCTADTTALQAQLSTCNSNLQNANSNLAQCTTALGTCNSALSTCNSALSTCNSDLSTCNSALSTCNSDLSTCNSALSTCNSDLSTWYSTNSKTAYWTSLNNHDGALTLKGNGKSVSMLMGMLSSFGGNKNSGNCIAYTSNQAKLFRLSAGECKTQHYFICKIPAHCL
ncbi:hypothetical protein B566_EDAN018261 [Ephemera danica]|nr:hypothetical protein B566_EDAN018261 [Ephemera danica]